MLYTKLTQVNTAQIDGVLMNNRQKRDSLFMKKQQEHVNKILDKNPHYEDEMNKRIEGFIDSAIESTPDHNQDKILTKTERKIKKLGLRLSREKLRVMIVNQIEDARMLEEARREEEAQAAKLDNSDNSTNDE